MLLFAFVWIGLTVTWLLVVVVLLPRLSEFLSRFLPQGAAEWFCGLMMMNTVIIGAFGSPLAAYLICKPYL